MTDFFLPSRALEGIDQPKVYRKVNVSAVMDAPNMGITWRCKGVVADGTLTIIAGAAGDGKTWLAYALAAATARGSDAAGIQCTQGKALVIDAEMGYRMSVDRFKIADIGPEELNLVDATGFSIADDSQLEYLHKDIRESGINLLILDSLRKLTPGVSENSSDEMAPLIAKIANLARETGTAIILIHHRGKNEGPFRGSTAIVDQADALFTLHRVKDEHDMRRLSCKTGKAPRYAPEPVDKFLHFAPKQGGFIASLGPSNTKEARKAKLLAAAPKPNKNQLAKAVGAHPGHTGFQTLFAELEAEGHELIIGSVLKTTPTNTNGGG